ncbi:MAG: ABC-2 transporter permease [Candidatus Latescibacteria bacterium]|jgi:ABC-type transport system involved in multi-copper enzyme maturation permease subunit|nr:ABC-2 transporter permease [Candidatus Latescibacterota bacterium]
MPEVENRLSSKAFLQGIGVIFYRELEAYFDAPIAYIYASVFLVLSCSTFMNAFFLNGVLEMAPYFEFLPFLLIPFIPAMTMRTWAEERAQHTFELLMTLPLQSLQIVLGKYFAALCFYLIVLSGTLPIVLMLLFLGSPDLGLIFSSYLGAFFLGAFFLSFGLFASGLTRDQIVAFVLGTLLGFVFVLSGHEKVVEILDGLAPAYQLGTFLYESLSIMPHYAAFTQGVVALPSLLYFALMSAFFIGMNDLSLKRSRY